MYKSTIKGTGMGWDGLTWCLTCKIKTTNRVGYNFEGRESVCVWIKESRQSVSQMVGGHE